MAVRRHRIQARPNINRVINNARIKKIDVNSVSTVESPKKVLTEELNSNDKKTENTCFLSPKLEEVTIAEESKTDNVTEKLSSSVEIKNEKVAIVTDILEKNGSEGEASANDAVATSDTTSVNEENAVNSGTYDTNNSDEISNLTSCLNSAASKNSSDPKNNEKTDDSETAIGNLEKTVAVIETADLSYSSLNENDFDNPDSPDQIVPILKDVTNNEECDDMCQYPLSPIKAAKIRSPVKTKKEIVNRRKYSKWKDPPDRSKMTVADLIYWNPTDNPMKSPSKAERAEENSIMPNSSQNNESPNSIINPPDEMSESSAPAPKLKIGPNGEITIDEESLYITPTVPVLSKTVLEAPPTTYASFREKKTTCKWDKEDTVVFYRALSIVGTDFSIMEVMLKNKWSRTDLKKKYKKELKINPDMLGRIAKMPGYSDLELFEEIREMEEKTATKKGLLKNEIKAKAQSLNDCMKSSLEESVKKKRGRKPKIKVENDSSENTPLENKQSKKARKKVPKTSQENVNVNSELNNEGLISASENTIAENGHQPKKKRGRKSKILSENVNNDVPQSDALAENPDIAEVEDNQPVKKKRGRKPKVQKDNLHDGSMSGTSKSTGSVNLQDNQTVMKKRGRKSKSSKDSNDSQPVKSRKNKRKQLAITIDARLENCSTPSSIAPRPKRACRKPVYLNEVDYCTDSDGSLTRSENSELVLDQNGQMRGMNESPSANIQDISEENEAILSINGTLQDIVVISETGEPIPCEVLDSSSNLEQLDFCVTDVVVESDNTCLSAVVKGIVESVATLNVRNNTLKPDNYASTNQINSENSSMDSKQIDVSKRSPLKKQNKTTQPTVSKSRRKYKKHISQNRDSTENPVVMDSSEIASYITVETSKRKKKKKSEDEDKIYAEKRIPKYTDFTVTESEFSSTNNHNFISETTAPSFDSNITLSPLHQIPEDISNIQKRKEKSEDENETYAERKIPKYEDLTVTESNLSSSNNRNFISETTAPLFDTNITQSPLQVSEDTSNIQTINSKDGYFTEEQTSFEIVNLQKSNYYVVLQVKDKNMSEVVPECISSSTEPEILESDTNFHKHDNKYNSQEGILDEFNSQSESKSLMNIENSVSSISQIKECDSVLPPGTIIKNENDGNIMKDVLVNEVVDVLCKKQLKDCKEDLSLHAITVSEITQELIVNVDKNSNDNLQQLHSNNNIIQIIDNTDNHDDINKLTQSVFSEEDNCTDEFFSGAELQPVFNKATCHKQHMYRTAHKTRNIFDHIVMTPEATWSISISNQDVGIDSVNIPMVDDTVKLNTVATNLRNLNQNKLKTKNSTIAIPQPSMNYENNIENDDSKNTTLSQKIKRITGRKLRPNISKSVKKSFKDKAIEETKEGIQLETVNCSIIELSESTNDLGNKCVQDILNCGSASNNLACSEVQKNDNQRIATDSIDATVIENTDEFDVMTTSCKNAKQNELGVKNSVIAVSKPVMNDKIKKDNSENKTLKRETQRTKREKFYPNVNKKSEKAIGGREENVKEKTIDHDVTASPEYLNDSHVKIYLHSKHKRNASDYSSADNLTWAEMQSDSQEEAINSIDNHVIENVDFNVITLDRENLKQNKLEIKNSETSNLEPIANNEAATDNSENKTSDQGTKRFARRKLHPNVSKSTKRSLKRKADEETNELLNKEDDFPNEAVKPKLSSCHNVKQNPDTPLLSHLSSVSVKTNKILQKNCDDSNHSFAVTSDNCDPSVKNISVETANSNEIFTSTGNNSNSDKNHPSSNNVVSTTNCSSDFCITLEDDCCEAENEKNKMDFGNNTKYRPTSPRNSKNFLGESASLKSSVKKDIFLSKKLEKNIEAANCLEANKNSSNNTQQICVDDAENSTKIAETMLSEITEVINAKLITVNSNETLDNTADSYKSKSQSHETTFSDLEVESKECQNIADSEIKTLKTRRSKFKPNVNVASRKPSHCFNRNNAKLTSKTLKIEQNKEIEKHATKEKCDKPLNSVVRSVSTKQIDIMGCEFQNVEGGSLVSDDSVKKIFTFVSSVNPTPERKLKSFPEELLSLTNIVSSMEDLKSLHHCQLTPGQEVILRKIRNGTIQIPVTPKMHENENGKCSFLTDPLPVWIPACQKNFEVNTEKESPKRITSIFTTETKALLCSTQAKRTSESISEDSGAVHQIINSFNKCKTIRNIENNDRTTLPCGIQKLS